MVRVLKLLTEPRWVLWDQVTPKGYIYEGLNYYLEKNKKNYNVVFYGFETGD